MKFLVEYHLLPLALGGRQFPVARRVIIEAEYMAVAMVKFVHKVNPGQDCDSVRIVEIDED